ncbi:hypothetical protein LCGC14_3100370 [marine sediment metagenome]|uniref:Uncharacterized protein n=1 Tax=marine sediment metagenome TaxID=412755 RepID=A0A0F8W7Y5_9ZZZZ
MTEISTWSLRQVDSDDEPLYDGMETNLNGDWVRLEEVNDILADKTRELREKLVVETARRLYWERCDENDTPRLFWDNLWDQLSSTRPELYKISKPYWIKKARAALKEAKNV